jgi:hypothetical protein
MTTIIDGNKMIVEHEGIVFEVSIEEITVPRSMEMLKLNDMNRNKSRKVIEQYARDMLNGDWDFLAADPIRLNAHNEILDGQQRLEALILAGQMRPDITLKTWLYWGIPSSSQVNMDTGRSRTRSDQLAIKKFNYPLERSAISTLLLRWVNPEHLFTNLAPTNREVLEFAEQNEDRLSRAIEHSRPLKKVGFAISVAGAVYFKAEEKEVFQASNFFTSIATGENLPFGHPALRLRTTVMNNKMGNGRRLHRLEELFYLVRSWNALRKGESLQKLQLPKEGREGLRPEHFTIK